MFISGKEVRIKGRLVRIAFINGEGYQFLSDPERAVKTIRESDERIDLFTFIQKLDDTTPKYSYPMEWENFAVLRISTFDEWMSHQIDFKVRNKVRKAAKKGVVVCEVPFDEILVKGIQGVYNESPVRQGMRFWHYGKDLEAVRRINGSFLDRSIFIGAFFQGVLVGFAKLVADESWNQAGLMQVLSMVCHRDKAVQNAIIAAAVRSCADRGVPNLWYAQITYGRKQRDSLAEFKIHNGFKRVEIPRYYIPLTAKGRMALSLGLQKETIDLVPGPVIAAFRKIRSFWYAKRFSNSQEHFLEDVAPHQNSASTD